MRLRNITGADKLISENKFVIKQPQLYKGSWNKFFKNDNPIHIEIGMGKGRFIMDMARMNPGISYLGIEKYASVLLRAVQKMELIELTNLRFICMNAENIEDIFDQHEVSCIYLNFSDPWPKDRHARRRLTSREFLERYHKILKPDGTLEFKTDNKDLFLFAQEELIPAGWQQEQATCDLHNDQQMMKNNIMTEYEERYSTKGNPIYKYIISR